MRSQMHVFYKFWIMYWWK